MAEEYFKKKIGCPKDINRKFYREDRRAWRSFDMEVQSVNDGKVCAHIKYEDALYTPHGLLRVYNEHEENVCVNISNTGVEEIIENAMQEADPKFDLKTGRKKIVD